MGFLFAFFLLSPWMWGGLFVATVLLASLVDDCPGFASVSFMAILAVIFLGRPDWITAVFYNPGALVIASTGYFVAGILWSFLKWYFFNLDELEKFKEGKLVRRGSQPQTLADARPKAKEHSARLVGWIAYWPWSVLKFVFGDMVVRISKRIYQLLSDRYEAVSRSVFSGTET